MRISSISTDLYRNKITQKNGKNYPYTANKLMQTDSVSFGAIEVAALAGWGINRLTSAAIGSVIKDGYKALKTAGVQAKYKNDLVSRFVNVNYHAQNGISPVDVLFALSKSPGTEEANGFWYSSVKDKYNTAFGLKELRDCAMKSLFPLVQEGVNDFNCGHAAKVALLTNMVDTGEYLNSQYFYKAFKNLPDSLNLPTPLNYNRNKIVLLEKMMRDKNAAKAARDYVGYDADEKRNLAITALISTLPSRYYIPFLRDYNSSIEAIYDKSYKLVNEKIINKNTYKPNEFYNTLYANGLTAEMQERDYISSINSVEKGTFIYVQPVLEEYYMDLMEYFKDHKKEGMKHFNTEEKYFDDMVRDYEMLKYVKNMKEKDVVKKLLKLRVDEKLKSNDENIKNTVAGFLNLSGRAKEFRDILSNEPAIAKNLSAQTQEARWKFAFYHGEFLESSNGIETANYRYDDDYSYLEKFDFLKKSFKEPDKIYDNKELYNEKRFSE